MTCYHCNKPIGRRTVDVNHHYGTSAGWHVPISIDGILYAQLHGCTIQSCVKLFYLRAENGGAYTYVYGDDATDAILLAAEAEAWDTVIDIATRAYEAQK